MSQPIRISPGFGSTLQYIPKITCIFPTKKKQHTCMDVTYPIHSMDEESRKRAWLSVSNRNPSPFLLHATTWKNEGLNEDLTGKRSKDDDFITMLTVRILRVLLDYDNPMDGPGAGHKILLKALRIWKKRVRFGYVSENYTYVASKHWSEISISSNNWPEVSTASTPWPEFAKELLMIDVIMSEINDPNDGFTVLNNALEVWNDLLSKVDKVHPFFYWLVMIVCKFVLNIVNTPTGFRRVLSLML